MPKKAMTKLIDALSVRTRPGQVMEEAEKENIRFLVSRRGKPAVVILGVEDYLL
jgi:prevent-host-death family protein